MRRGILASALLIALIAPVGAQGDREAAWNAFMAWFEAAPAAANPLAGYGAKLQKDGKAPDDVKREMALLMTLMAERSDWIGLYYDKVYVRPSTGDPVADGFASRPGALVADAIKGVKPGTALDVGIGQGRNALFSPSRGGR